MPITRRVALLIPFALAACGDDGPPRVFAPLRYAFLVPLRLNVGGITYAPLPPPGPLDGLSPVQAGPAIQQMAQDRLSAGGSSGRAVVLVDDARITRAAGGLDGSFALRVEVFSADNTRSGFAEARVARTATVSGRDLRPALYDITRQMLDDLNVELEFQVRRSLRDYLQTTTTAPAPAAVQQQDLAAPGVAPTAAPVP